MSHNRLLKKKKVVTKDKPMYTLYTSGENKKWIEQAFGEFSKKLTIKNENSGLQESN